MLKVVAVQLSELIDQRVDQINMMNDTKVRIKQKLQQKFNDQVLDINIRRMRAQIVKREEFERKKRQAEETKK